MTRVHFVVGVLCLVGGALLVPMAQRLPFVWVLVALDFTFGLANIGIGGGRLWKERRR